MSDRLEQLAERRHVLQARCAVQRAEIIGIHAELDVAAARIDRVVVVARRLGPLLVAAGLVAAVAVGPGRLLGAVRQALPLALLASRAARLLR